MVREVLPRCMNEGPVTYAFVESIITERARIDRQINDLTQVRARLDEIIVVATAPDHPDHWVRTTRPWNPPLVRPGHPSRPGRTAS